MNKKSINELTPFLNKAITNYLEIMGDHDPTDLLDLVTSCVEASLIQKILDHTDGNQSRAANILGINRGTLRKKIKCYQLNITTK